MKKAIKNMRRYRDKILLILGIAILIAYLFPVFWMIGSSFKTLDELMQYPPTLLPEKVTFQNYGAVFEAHVFRYMLNSLFMGLITTGLTIILSTLAGYSLSRLRVGWIKWIVLIFLVGQMIPQILLITPLFLVFEELGLYNTYLAVILGKTAVSIPLAVIMLRTTFLSIPQELEDAALIDGCNRLEAFIKVVLPLAKTGIFVVGVITFLFAYGDFIFSLSFLDELRKQSATVGLFTFIGQHVTKWNEVMAFANIIIIPVVGLFLAIQEKLVKGQIEGAF